MNSRETKETRVRNEDLGVPLRVRQYIHPTGGNYSTSSGSWSLVPDIKAEYTAGPQDETVLITIMILHVHDGAGGGYIRPVINGVSQLLGYYSNNGPSWNQSMREYLVDVDANSKITVQLEWYASGGGGPTQISRSSSFHTPHILFEAYPRQP